MAFQLQEMCPVLHLALENVTGVFKNTEMKLVNWVSSLFTEMIHQSLRSPPGREGWRKQKRRVAALLRCHGWRNMVCNFFFSNMVSMKEEQKDTWGLIAKQCPFSFNGFPSPLPFSSAHRKTRWAVTHSCMATALPYLETLRAFQGHIFSWAIPIWNHTA